MRTQEGGTPPSRAVRAEASVWIAKLHGPERSPDLEADFRAWLGTSAENARAFEHMTDIWQSIAHVEVGGMPRLSKRDAFEARSRRAPLRLAVACAIVVALAGFWWSLSNESYSTGIGEQRIVRLEDGSRVHLNSGTRMDVELGDAMRRVRLERGEAFFEVARDPRKPFVVVAGDRSVTALGTSFVVRFEPQQTAVTLVEGKVAIRAGRGADSGSASPAHEADALILRPGERATFAASGVATVDVPPVDATAAWRRGEVVLDETPLSLAVTEMNRYQRKRLVLDDPSIGELPVSGIYRTGSSEDFAHAIATVYGLEVVQNGDEIHLRRQN